MIFHSQYDGKVIIQSCSSHHQSELLHLVDSMQVNPNILAVGQVVGSRSVDDEKSSIEQITMFYQFCAMFPWFPMVFPGFSNLFPRFSPGFGQLPAPWRPSQELRGGAVGRAGGQEAVDAAAGAHRQGAHWGEAGTWEAAIRMGGSYCWVLLKMIFYRVRFIYIHKLTYIYIWKLCIYIYIIEWMCNHIIIYN